jgi:hypothetical protein
VWFHAHQISAICLVCFRLRWEGSFCMCEDPIFYVF